MIAVVLLQIGLIKDVPYTGERKVDIVGAVLSVLYQRPDGCKRVGLLAAGRIERETD